MLERTIVVASFEEALLSVVGAGETDCSGSKESGQWCCRAPVLVPTQR